MPSGPKGFNLNTVVEDPSTGFTFDTVFFVITRGHFTHDPVTGDVVWGVTLRYFIDEAAFDTDQELSMPWADQLYGSMRGTLDTVPFNGSSWNQALHDVVELAVEAAVLSGGFGWAVTQVLHP